MSNQDFPVNSFGSTTDAEYAYLYNRTGGALVAGDVAAMNDLGTNTTYDTVDGASTDVDKNVIAIAATEINCRMRVAAEAIADGAKGKFWVRGRVPIKVSSLAATAVMGATLTVSSAAADGSTIVAKQLHARLANSGTGPLNAITAAQQTYGITKEATATAAAVVICDFEGDGKGLVGV